MIDSSNGNPNQVRLDRPKDPISAPDRETIISSLKDIDPIAYQYYFNPFMGKTKAGHMCYFPESYRRGYQDFLDGRNLLIELELFAVGQTSVGDWVFLPSYFQGVDSARNELKFALLAESQRRLFEETSKASEKLMKQSQSIEVSAAESTRTKDALVRFQTGYENLRTENENLKKIVESQGNSFDEYKKEIEELRGQVQEIRTVFQDANAQQVKSSSTSTPRNEIRQEKRKGAAPIS